MILALLLIGLEVGERMDYSAHYGFLDIGSLTMEIRDSLTHEGRPCLTIVSILASNPGLSFLFSLNDTITAIATRDSLLPLYVEENLHEGKYTARIRQVFDRTAGTVTYDDSLVIPVPAATRDLLSFWYYLRTVPLEIGASVPVNVHKSKQTYAVDCPVTKRERIKTDAGEFPALLVEPQADGKGIFGTKGAMAIWYADTAGRYPVQIKTAMKYGKINFKLRRIQLEGGH